MKVKNLYEMAQESEVAYECMERLCELLGVTFPPEASDMTEITQLDQFAYTSEEAFRRDQI